MAVAFATTAQLAPLDERVALAGVTSTWTVDSYEQWNEGEADFAFITSLGEVKPGWKTERTAVEADGIWAALRLSDGSIVLGTDDNGAVYRVSAKADAKAKAPQKLAAISSAVAVVSLAEGPGGMIYAGTMPAGEIWTIDPKSGKAAKLAALNNAETVWALAFDAQGKTLYAGTGPDGELFAVDPKTGSAKVAFATEDKRITALVADREGAIWLGTSEQALVFRYDPASGTARAMADFSGNEITALAASAGGIIVAANEFTEPATTGIKTRAAVDKADNEDDNGQKAKMPERDSVPGADKPSSGETEPERPRARAGKGALFRVQSDSRIEQLHALTATYFTDVAVTETGRIFAGAGDKGRIYLIDTDDSVSTAFDVDERLIAKLLYAQDSGIVFATSDVSALYRTAGVATQATYTSEVYDTKAPSRFGKLVWHHEGKIKVETRTGNTATPGKGWSGFAEPKSILKSGGNSESGRVASPSGRYIQYRVTFTGGEEAVLRKTALYFLPQNRPTRVTEIEVKPSGSGKDATLKSDAADPRSPVIELSWTVDNPDSDSSRYELEVRREGEALWRPIAAGKKSLTTTKYKWNTETVPDGYYRLRVTALDDRANSSDRALQHAKVTELFLVDNEKPSLSGISVDYPRASARAADAMSAIAEAAYSVDDGPWRVAPVNDGIFDDLTETLSIRLPEGLEPGMHTLAIRVADEAGNLGLASVTFRVK